MTPPDGAPILSSDAMRAAEQAAIAAGTSADTLMARAGTGIARWAQRLGADHDMLVLCGPGNNGGDGYVAARVLAAAGCDVRIAASAPPATATAAAACAQWAGGVEPLETAGGAAIVIDCLFGTGLSRPLDAPVAAALARLVGSARIAIAADLPSGIDADRAEPLGDVPRVHLTCALGTLKPAHLLEPAASHCGAVRLIDIGVAVPDGVRSASPPQFVPPGPDAHKYTRGMVAIIGGVMPGASALAAEAALRAGAGYALMLGGAGGGPLAGVHREFDAAALADSRIGAVVVGPGLGRDAAARAKLDAALASFAPLVIDGDALHLVDPMRLRERTAPVILTPHAGEFAALFGASGGNKIARAQLAAAASGATIVFKGADTVIADPGGAVRVRRAGQHWLSTAGTGDVLAGAIAAMLAGGLGSLAAAEAGVWLHAEAARRLGASFIADDLARAISAARGAL